MKNGVLINREPSHLAESKTVKQCAVTVAGGFNPRKCPASNLQRPDVCSTKPSSGYRGKQDVTLLSLQDMKTSHYFNQQ